MKPMRSWMFVPGNIQRFLDKAPTSTADVLLFDLEDGVLPKSKESARAMVSTMLTRPAWTGPLRFVRVNAAGSQWFEQDLQSILVPGLDGLCLPKVEEPQVILDVCDRLAAFEAAHGTPAGTVRLIAAIESAKGMLAAPAIAAAHPRVLGLMFGAEDFALDLGLGTHREGEAAQLLNARSTLVIAAAASGVLSIDGVFPDLDDPTGLYADVLQARRIGFSAKSTFNPRQVDVINRLFAPQPDEIEYARRVVHAFAEAKARGEASVAVGGQLVDLPILRRAERVLELADVLATAGA